MEKQAVFIAVCTTDGNALLNVDEIVSAVTDPSSPTTTMVHMSDGRYYEISGGYQELFAKVWEARLTEYVRCENCKQVFVKHLEKNKHEVQVVLKDNIPVYIRPLCEGK